jgi:ubiquitin carboxyl-terminal hydrolase L3
MSNWQPLESNCEVINKYLSDIGLDISHFVFQDLLSTEEWAQDMILKPVLGLLFIFEITDKQEDFRKKEEEALAMEGQVVVPDLFYMKQFAQNACGTVGVFHILGNLPEAHKHLVKDQSLLANFYAKVHGKSAEEAGKIFENNDELKEKHVTASEAGHTNVNEHQETCNHFIAIVEKGGYVYELDGRKKRPINHGPTTSETFLQDACAVAKGFMDREPENVNAGLIVLAPQPLE